VWELTLADLALAAPDLAIQLGQRRLEIALSRKDRSGVLAQRPERIKFGLRIGERMIDKRAVSSRHLQSTPVAES
jgi:hypothetical protein